MSHSGSDKGKIENIDFQRVDRYNFHTFQISFHFAENCEYDGRLSCDILINEDDCLFNNDSNKVIRQMAENFTFIDRLLNFYDQEEEDRKM